MKMILFLSAFLLLGSAAHPQAYHLIAHRGGVVDSVHAENSLPALEAAIKQGYWMVEVDLRLTKDGVFILQHDRSFKNHFGVDKMVSTLTWDEISKLRSDQGGSGVITLDEALRRCRGKLQVMIDNKVPGNDTLMFSNVVRLLKKYNLLEGALMIGTDESTEYFTGKIKLSCTRQQLEANKRKPGFRPRDFYLFGGADTMTAGDVAWAGQEGILVVGAINRWHYREAANPDAAIASDIAKLKSWGVKNFQIDSEFSVYFGK